MFFLFVALTSGFVFFSGLFSFVLKDKFGVSGALASTLFGLLCRGLFSIFSNTSNFHNEYDKDLFLKELSRIAVSLQVVAVGMYVPKNYLRREWKSLVIVLFPFTVATFLFSTYVAHQILPVSAQVALAIGACVTPTDPVLAATIMKGRFASKYVPTHIRNLLTAESGANDGFGSCLLALGLMDYTDWKKPVFKLVFIDTILAVSLGYAVGHYSRKLLLKSKKSGWIDKESFLGSLVCLSLFVTSLTALCNSADILACFACGLAFMQNENLTNSLRKSHFLEVIDMLVNHVFFILFGLTVKLNLFTTKMLFYSLIVLVFRRLPLFLLFKKFVPQLKTFREAFFAGYFGPIGVGAILFGYHGLHMIENRGLLGENILMPVLECVTLFSVVLHGIVGIFLTRTIKTKEDPEESEYDTHSNCLVSSEEESLEKESNKI